MSIEIPPQLKKPQFKFCLLEGDTKKPFEPLWNTRNNYPYVDPKLLNHLQQGNNYGSVCGYGGLGILDLDEMSILNDIERILPPTFTIETGSGKRHYYFLVPTGTPKIIFTKNGIHYGELQSTGSQCVGAGSIHPITKNQYKVIKDIEIAELPQAAVNKLKELYSDEVNEEPIKVVNWDMYNKSQIDFPINSLIHKLGNLKTRGNELYGSHPVHGSQTGMNFFVNTSKNIWHCFRCNSGGDALALLAVKEGVCDCKDFSPGGKKLRGEDFKKVLDIAKRDYGVRIESKTPVELEKQHLKIYKEQKEVKIITDFELDAMDFEPIVWIVEHLIPKGSLILVAGKTETKKSFIITFILLHICYKLKLMDRFNVFSDTNCLYFDEDNPPFLTKHRNKILRKGLNLGPTKKLGYVLSSGIRIDSSEGLNKLVELIELFKPKLVILDSLVRFISKGKTDENRSGDMSDIFTNLRRVANEYDTSFLIIHHSNKSLIQNDEADVIRGSSDIINAVDCAYLFKASGDNIKIQQIKNRYEPKIKPFTVSDVQTVDKDGKTVSLKFEITSTEVDKMDVESRTAVAIYAHFSRDEFLKNGEKVFQTKDAITKFSQELHTSENKARQIIATSLRKLIRDGKIRRIKQGYYKILDMNEERISTLSDFDETEPEEENETEDLT